jgi:hypothetical protein
MATLILFLLSGDIGCAPSGHRFNFTGPLQQTLVSDVPSTLTIHALDRCPLDFPFLFHKFLLMSLGSLSKGYLFSVYLSKLTKPQGTSPPTQL